MAEPKPLHDPDPPPDPKAWKEQLRRDLVPVWQALKTVRYEEAVPEVRAFIDRYRGKGSGGSEMDKLFCHDCHEDWQEELLPKEKLPPEKKWKAAGQSGSSGPNYISGGWDGWVPGFGMSGTERESLWQVCRHMLTFLYGDQPSDLAGMTRGRQKDLQDDLLEAVKTCLNRFGWETVEAIPVASREEPLGKRGQGEALGAAEDWITVSQAERISGVNKGVVSRAADSGEITTNGERGRVRRLHAGSFAQWVLQRSDTTLGPSPDCQEMIRQAKEARQDSGGFDDD